MRQVHIIGVGDFYIVEIHTAAIVACAMGDISPDLFCGEGENGSEHQSKRAHDLVHNGLSRTARQAVCTLNVYSVLDDVDIELGHINGAEVVDIMVNIVEFVVGVGIVNALNECIEASESPLVDLGEVFNRYGIGIGIEIAEVCKKNTNGISDLAIYFRKLL